MLKFKFFFIAICFLQMVISPVRSNNGANFTEIKISWNGVIGHLKLYSADVSSKGRGFVKGDHEREIGNDEDTKDNNNLDEDIEEFCTQKGRSASKKDPLYDLLSNNHANDKKRVRRFAETQLLDEILVGCPTEKGSTPVSNMDHEFMRVSTLLTNALVSQETKEGMEKLAATIKNDPRVNYRLYWLSVVKAINRRKDFQGQNVPNAAEFLPEFFVPFEILEKTKGRETTDEGTCFNVDEQSGTQNGDENVMFYFREDVGLNSHHQYWHIIHAFEAERLCTSEDTSDNYACHENRRGELFSFMHNVVLAKYHTERTAVCLPEIVEFKLEIGGIIEPGYFPAIRLKPDGTTAWRKRPNKTAMPIAVRLDLTTNKACKFKDLKLKNLVKNAYNVQQIIGERKYKSKDNKTMALTIDVLGDILESTKTSPNMPLYGALHNDGHVMIGKSADDGDSVTGVMVDTATAMRDPTFYRWHYYINNFFNQYQRSLPPHEVDKGEFPLQWEGIVVENVEVREVKEYSEKNQLNTFFRNQQVRIPVPSLNSTRRICFKGLDHRDFEYKISVNNNGRKVKGTVRIYLAPKFGADGKSRMSLLEQRKFLFPMDIYNVEIPEGKSILPKRSSLDSTVTTARCRGGAVGGESTFNCRDERCGCGIPHNFLIPRGKEIGMEFDLVVMITDGEKYQWAFSKDDEKISKCKLAPVVCSLPGFGGRKYPDLNLPMGYPFDRLPYILQKPGETLDHFQYHVKTMDDYVGSVSNMGMVQIRITHHNIFVKNQDWRNPKNIRKIKSIQPNTICPTHLR